LPTDVVQTFYSWVSDLAKQLHVPVPQGADDDNRYQRKLKAVLAYIERKPMSPLLDVALVDEGQDLPAEAYRLLKHLSRHVTVFADYAQQLYDDGAHVSEIAGILGVSRESMVLLCDLRTSRDVAKVAARFLQPDEAERYLRTRRPPDKPGERRIPVLFRATTFNDEWDYLASVVAQEIHDNRRVGILVPVNYLVYLVHKQLGGRGVSVVEVERFGKVNFNELSPKVLTVHSAKGLTFDTVLMPEIAPRWYNPSKQPVEPLLFVGITRARNWVCLLTTRGREIAELSRLQSLIDEGVLIEKTSQRPAGTGQPPVIDPYEDMPL